MHDAEFNKTKTVKYLIWTFALAYVVQIGAAYLYNHVNRTVGQLAVAAMMFVPTIGVLLAGQPLTDMGWKPQIRKNIRIYLAAWFLPAVLTAAGAALYFLIFPGHFDLSGEYVKASVGEQAFAQMEAQGLTYSVYVLITSAACITYAPLFNMFLGLGEEIGWRGFLYPQLNARFGKKTGRLLGGVIWGAWHWPLIWLIGYEYGAAVGNSAGYAGFPVTGMLLFSVIAAGWGILHDRLYEKSGSIWVPSLFHGAINAAANLPLTVCLTDTGSARLLGPAPMGILAGLPFLLMAAGVLAGGRKAPPSGSH
jgi:membrane protease YdiL (CAAX protease family)